jgi:hypothetical protein
MIWELRFRLIARGFPNAPLATYASRLAMSGLVWSTPPTVWSSGVVREKWRFAGLPRGSRISCGRYRFLLIYGNRRYIGVRIAMDGLQSGLMDRAFLVVSMIRLPTRLSGRIGEGARGFTIFLEPLQWRDFAPAHSSI